MFTRRLAAMAALLGFVVDVGCSAEEAASATDGPAADGGSTTAQVEAGPAQAPPPEAGPPADATPPRTRVPVFVAQGKLGRTTISCDDGRTWIADHSQFPDARCFDSESPNNMECDHNAWSASGLVTSGDFFLAAYGHGEPGVIQRSEDGIVWEDVLDRHWFGGLAAGNGTIMGLDRAPWISTAGGAKESWTGHEYIELPGGAVRGGSFSPFGGGTFFLHADGNVMLRSTDNGVTWASSPTVPEGCARNGFVHGNGATLIPNSDGSLCRSADGGATWTYAKVTESFGSSAIFADGAFQIWSGATRWRSTDGVTWAEAPITGATNLGAVARGESGTYVAVLGGWQVWYEKQVFYRSVDGLAWEALPDGAYTKSHPISAIVAGFAKPSAQCPL